MINPDLQSDLIILENNVKKASDLSGQLSDELDTVCHALALPGTITEDLGKVDGYIQTVVKLLEALSAFPQLHDRAKPMADIGKNIEKPLHAFVNKAEEFDKIVAPARKLVEKTEEGVKQVHEVLGHLDDELDDFKRKLVDTRNCINSLPQGDIKAGLQNSLKSLTDECDAAAKKTTATKKTAEDALQALLNTLKITIKSPLHDFIVFYDPIHQLRINFEKLVFPLQDLVKLLDTDISYRLDYPCPELGDLKKMCHYDINLRISLVLKGVSDIEERIKKLLSEFFMELVKKIGLENVVNWFVNEARKLTREIIDKLHLDFKIEIPGLDLLLDLQQKIELVLPNFLKELTDELKQKLDNLLTQVKAMEETIRQLENIFETCTSNYKLRYGDTLGAKSQKWNNFISARSSGDRAGVELMNDYNSWEFWTILSTANSGRRDQIRYNDTVVLKSLKWGNYLSAREGGNNGNVQMMADPASWEEWIILNPDNPASRSTLGITDPVAFKSCRWGNYLSARGGGNHQAVNLMIDLGPWEKWNSEYRFPTT